ncbi:MAG TPA: hypothetical protein VF331_07215 [Polyangiales bacterium]
MRRRSCEQLSIASGGFVAANGGSGASGNASNANNGLTGIDGAQANGAPASGGVGKLGGGHGGDGGSASLPATGGVDGACSGGVAFCSGGTHGAAGGVVWWRRGRSHSRERKPCVHAFGLVQSEREHRWLPSSDWCADANVRRCLRLVGAVRAWLT